MLSSRTKLFAVGVGSGVAAALLAKRLVPALAGIRNRRLRDDRRPPRNDLAADVAEGPAYAEELEVDIEMVPNQEVISDMDAMSDEDLDASPIEGVGDQPPTLDAIEQSMHDAGDLYGGHTPAASDPHHPDDDRAMDEGENWVEALQADVIEGGALPEHELDAIVDDADTDLPPHPSDTHDRPVADRGAGGPRGT
ncbi:MAG: hypothetical protein AB7L28_11305 [Kofleriaceae bacterium]